MADPFPQWLAEHARGGLPLESLEARARTLVGSDAVALQRSIAAIRAARASGAISQHAADVLLAILTSADSRTQVLADPTVAQRAGTLIRSPNELERDPTELAADRVQDATEAADRTMAEATLRQAAAEVTERKLAAGENDPTQRAASATLHRSPDATIAAATEARPLKAPHADPNASAPTKNASDRTEVIADRLVKTLDGVEDVHHGQLQPGDVLKKRFVLESLVGKGGMGLVFSALDRRKEEAHDPNPRVALKVLNADFQRHPQSLIALQREARKAQTLAHPNVVTVFDFDRDGDAVYMTMELLKGRALEALVKEARGVGVAPAIALPIIRGIAEGLAYAHRKGIVHSDLKPGNVFVLDDGTPKILDFGIARAIPNAAASEVPDIFDAGMLGAYTEAYATDEMVEGVDPHPADDMYALGIIAYELLTGFHPYQRHSAPKARKLGAKPPPLKGLKLREARALERCLSFDRNQRPKNAAEFLKLFRGVTAVQKALIAATVVLTVTAGYLSYDNYRQSGPAIAFANLPAAQQREFLQEMREGDQEWAFFQREGNPTQVMSAVERYAAAYSVHPRNREASAALRKAADAFLSAAGDDADARRTAARYLIEQSDFYRRYPPVVAASE